jgi:hypothetical protein
MVVTRIGYPAAARLNDRGAPYESASVDEEEGYRAERRVGGQSRDAMPW